MDLAQNYNLIQAFNNAQLIYRWESFGVSMMNKNNGIGKATKIKY